MMDVILIGRGPAGLTMAALLARLGHSVAVVERHRDMYGLPRAGHVDHEIVRLLAALESADAMLEDSYPTVEYTWVNAAGETLLDFDWGAKSVSGYNSDYMQFQPLIESALNERLNASSNVKRFHGVGMRRLRRSRRPRRSPHMPYNGRSPTQRSRYADR